MGRSGSSCGWDTGVSRALKSQLRHEYKEDQEADRTAPGPMRPNMLRTFCCCAQHVLP